MWTFFFGPEAIKNVLSLLSFVLSVAALTMSVITSQKQMMFTKENVRNLRDSDWIKWSNEMIDIICQLEGLCSLNEKLMSGAEFLKTRNDISCKLSAGIDKGRFYFPNEIDPEVAAHKAAAYQGIRPYILDTLVEIYKCSMDVEQSTDEEMGKLREQITIWKRNFVSEIQTQIDPRRRISFIKTKVTV
jgi:hypothetical protein